MKVISFIGPANSGKTSLILRIVNELKSTHKICVVKNDPGDKAEFDRQGKDSYNFFRSGADVFVTSPSRTTFFAHYPSRFSDLLPQLKKYDIVFIEGMRYLSVPTIAVFHRQVEEDYLPFAQAYTVREGYGRDEFVTKIFFQYEDTVSIIQWILSQKDL